jgi:HD-GYP domain-containing protein (c-di-GMP phosphodiesterase class II)
MPIRSQMVTAGAPATVNLGDILTGLSHALDITEGHPRGHTARSCLIGMRIADLVGLPSPGRTDLFYALLLKDAGCSSTSKRRERGANVARRLGLSEATATAILTMDERWDGRGAPHGLRAADIPILGRVIGLAQAVEVFAHQHSPERALEAVEQHSGTWFDPDLVRAYQSLVQNTRFWDRLTTEDAQTLVATLGPRESAIPADEQRLDDIAEAFASLIDAKSPFTSEHSRRVAMLAVEIGRRLGFSAAQIVRLRRAALLHDIGKLGVPNRILDKPSGLTTEEWSIVRQHPAHTLHILRAVPGFRDFAFDAACHHEKLDGSGYHRGYTAERLTPTARALAVADIADALLADRPYRPSMEPGDALRILRGDTANGKLCPASAAAVADIVTAGAHLTPPDAAFSTAIAV